MVRSVRRGDIFYYTNNSINGSIQRGSRPVLIVSNNKDNVHSPVVTMVPLTGQAEKKLELPTHVPISPKQGNGLNRKSLVLAEQITSVNRTDLGSYKGHIDSETMSKVGEAIKVHLKLTDN